MNDNMTAGLHVEITGDASSVVSAAGQAGSALSGFEGVSAEAMASLTAALETLNLNFAGLVGSSAEASAGVAKVGAAAAGVTLATSEATAAGGSMAGMFSTIGGEAGAAAGRISAFAATLAGLSSAALPMVGILAGMTVAFKAYNAYKEFMTESISLATDMQQRMDSLRATVEANGQSWGQASASIKSFIDVESMASGVTKGELTGNLNHLAAAIGSVSDAERIMRLGNIASSPASSTLSFTARLAAH